METFSVQKYWNDRYKSGSNSGDGSYGDEAQYKAEVVNETIKETNSKNIQEVGVGDGNNLRYYNIPEAYIGYDISEEAIIQCRHIFNGNTKFHFTTKKDEIGFDADLCLCLDVLFHQVEKELYEETLDLLFKRNAKFVLIYSYNSDDNTGMSIHMKMRKVTDDVKKYANYELLKLTGSAMNDKYFALYKKTD